jgi:hypothetical protein
MSINLCAIFPLVCRPDIPTGYMSGGPGYILSKEALDRFVTKVCFAIDNERFLRTY